MVPESDSPTAFRLNVMKLQIHFQWMSIFYSHRGQAYDQMLFIGWSSFLLLVTCDLSVSWLHVLQSCRSCPLTPSGRGMPNWGFLICECSLISGLWGSTIFNTRFPLKVVHSLYPISNIARQIRVLSALVEKSLSHQNPQSCMAKTVFSLLALSLFLLMSSIISLPLRTSEAFLYFCLWDKVCFYFDFFFPDSHRGSL